MALPESRYCTDCGMIWRARAKANAKTFHPVFPDDEDGDGWMGCGECDSVICRACAEQLAKYVAMVERESREAPRFKAKLDRCAAENVKLLVACEELRVLPDHADEETKLAVNVRIIAAQTLARDARFAARKGSY